MVGCGRNIDEFSALTQVKAWHLISNYCTVLYKIKPQRLEVSFLKLKCKKISANNYAKQDNDKNKTKNKRCDVKT